jgi:hypothetical protein
MRTRLISVPEIVVLLIAIVLLALLGLSTAHSKPFASAELKFTDASAQGLSIVPASCASFPHYGGDCTGQVEGGGSGAGACVPHNICLGGTNVINSCTGGVVQACSWGCVDGGCLPPPPAYEQFVATFTDTSVPGGGSTPVTFTATGHLQAKPLLTRLGTTAQLYWSVSNAASCTISGNNGDSFSGTSSGSAGQTTGALTSQTTYILLCQSLPKVTPASISESVTVNVAPVFQEL